MRMTAANGDTFTASTDEGVEITFVVTNDTLFTVCVGDSTNTAIDDETAKKVTIPQTVSNEEVSYSVTSIAANAFAGCTEISQVVLPASLTAIGSQAFSGCSSLTKVIARMEEPFKLDASSFTGVSANCGLHIPDGTMEAYTEAGWTTSVFKNGVVYGENTLLKGDSFTVADINGVDILYVVTDADLMTARVGDATNPAISVETEGAVTIPATVEYEGQTYNVTAVGNNAFKSCAGITAVSLPEGITTVGQYAFYSCTALTTTNIPDGVKSIGAYAFNGCTNLTDVDLPGTLTSIGNYAFKSCKSMTRLVIPGTVTSIGTESFSYMGIKELVLSEGVQKMSYAAFANCTSLQTVSLPTSLTSIGQQAFRQNTSLLKVDIPEGVKSLSKDAFRTCSNLVEVILPSTLTSSKTPVFENCKKLTKVIARMQKPFTMPSTMFASTNPLIALHIPDGTREDYIAAGWTTDTFKGGIIYGDDTPAKGFTFTYPTKEDIDLTFMVSEPENWDVSVGNGNNTAVDTSASGIITIPDSVVYEDMTYHVSTIAGKAFSNCSDFETVVLPATLDGIEAQAFNGCLGLKAVIARMDTPFNLNADAFANISNYCGLHVPEGKKQAYIDAGWTKDIFKGGVVEGDSTMTGGVRFTLTNADGIEITYVIVDVDEMTVQVGDDSMTAVTDTIEGILTIPLTVEYAGQSYQVTTIGSNAFNGCARITEINLPDSLTNIGTSAFQDCTGLSEITLPEGLSSIASAAFSGCTGLTVEILPSTLTSLGSNAFGGCSSLTKVIARMEEPFKLDASSFSGVSANCGLHIPDGTMEAYTEAGWTTSVFKNGVVYGENTLLKGDSFTVADINGVDILYVVTDADLMTARVGDATNPAISVETEGAVTIPATVEYEGQTYNVTAVGNNAFKSCAGITAVSLPEGITTVGQYAFYSCTALTTTNIPDGVKSIGAYAFNGCTNLTDVDLPGTLTSIGNYAFKSCKSMTRLVIPGTVTSIGTESFSYMGIKELVLSEGVQKMSYAAFANCTSLQTVSLPTSLTSIGQQAFRQNTSLLKVDIPEGVKSLSKDAFRTCSNLVEVILPSTLTSSKTPVFENCKKLTKVIARMQKPFTMPSTMFASTNPLIALHIPDGTREDYIAAGWTTDTFKGGIVYGDDTPTKGFTFTSLTEDGIELTFMVSNPENWEVSVGDGSSAALDISTAGTVTIPDSVDYEIWTYHVSSIAGKAFDSSSYLETAILPASLKEISSLAFNDCIRLTSVMARMNPPFELVADAFNNISNYCGLHVPEGTRQKYIDSGWTTDIFKGGVVEGDDALTGGLRFTQINSDGIEITYVIVNVDERTVQVGDDLEIAIPQDTEGILSIPSTVEYEGEIYRVETIGTNAFKGCGGLTEVRLPETLQFISKSAFSGCTGLSQLILPNGLKQISENSFADCTGLTAVTIPESVVCIGPKAFEGCLTLTKVTSWIMEPFTLDASVFNNINLHCELLVPAGTGNAYIAAGWTKVLFLGGVYENVRADVNHDGNVDVSDVVEVANRIANGADDDLTFDVNADGFVNVTDIVSIINFIGSPKEPIVIDTYVTDGMPVVFINTPDKVGITSKEVYVENTTFSILTADGKEKLYQGKVKGRGNSTWKVAKKSFAVKFDSKEKVLDMPKNKSWVLLANYYDPTLMRNDLAYFIGNELSNLDYTPHFNFVSVILNGKFNGIYQVGEKLKIGKNRVNVGDDGFLVEIDAKVGSDPDARYFKVSHIGQPINIKDPDVEYNDSNFLYVKSSISKTSANLFSANYCDEEIGWKKDMDMDSFVDWYIINELAKNNDATFYTSCYMNLARNGKLKMGPLWDFDLGFGGYPWEPRGSTISNLTANFYVKKVSWYTRLFTDPAFVSRLKERFNHFYDNRQKIYFHIDANVEILKSRLYDDNKLWGRICAKTATEEEVLSAYQQKVDALKDWIEERFQWLYENINNL